MLYYDLTYRRVGSDAKGYTVFTSDKNIGWLWSDFVFNTGREQDDFIGKVRDILFIPIANSSGLIKGGLPKIKLDFDIFRSPPINCPICGESIFLKPENLMYYSGSSTIQLGGSAICVPSLVDGEYYYFPSLIYHYVIHHHYSPPKEFVDAVVGLSFSEPYDAAIYHKNKKFMKVSTERMQELDCQIIFNRMPRSKADF